MYPPGELQQDRPLKWSVGKGTDVWALFRACVDGNLSTVEELLGRDPALVRSQYHYRKPLYFAVRENRLDVAAYLLERDPDPFGLAVNDSLVEIARDRGYDEMERLLTGHFARRFGASPAGEPAAAAIRKSPRSSSHAVPEFQLLDSGP